MLSVDGSRELLLTDGTYFVQLDPARRVDADVATAYLGRRRIAGGVTVVGSAEMQNDGRWRASVATDPVANAAGYTRVACDCENRLDALVALWNARQDAFLSI
jgi:hypothetical protein